MPFFGKKKKDDSQKDVLPKADALTETSSVSTSSTNGDPKTYQMKKRNFSFQCQLAHGSPTGIISDFKNVKELYIKIAECFEINIDDILFCTLNTHKIDMEHLLGSQIGLDDFIFVHIKGQKKEIDLYKSEESLGLTITDNGAGRAFIKRIRESSQISKLSQGLVDVGDHIEKIDDETFLGKRHFDVAKKLRSIEVGAKFTIRLISPEKSIYSNLKSRSEFSSKSPVSILNGKKTLRLTDLGVFEEEISSNNMDELAIDIIARHVEKVLGISDNEMAQLILDIGKKMQNPADFTEKINEELGEFLFPKLLLHDLWGVVTDAKAGLLVKGENSSMTDSTILTTSSAGYTNIVYEDRF